MLANQPSSRMRSAQINTLVILTIGSLAVFAQDKLKPVLPADTSDLVSKLEAFEAERRAAAENEIAAKRSEVIKLLQQHLEREAKAGNLDSSVAIKATIATLSGSEKRKIPEGVVAGSEPKAEPEPVPASESTDDFRSWLEMVEFVDERNDIKYFVVGNALVTRNGPESEFPSELDSIDEEELRITWKFQTGTKRWIVLKRSRRSGTVFHATGKEMGDVRVEERKKK